MPVLGFPESVVRMVPPPNPDAIRVIDVDPEFFWNEDEPFPAALVDRARDHARQWHEFAFVGTAARWRMVNDWRGIFFVVLGCTACGTEIGRGIVWLTSSSDNAYPWQEGYWQTRRVA